MMDIHLVEAPSYSPAATRVDTIEPLPDDILKELPLILEGGPLDTLVKRRAPINWFNPEDYLGALGLQWKGQLVSGTISTGNFYGFLTAEGNFRPLLSVAPHLGEIQDARLARLEIFSHVKWPRHRPLLSLTSHPDEIQDTRQEHPGVSNPENWLVHEHRTWGTVNMWNPPVYRVRVKRFLESMHKVSPRILNEPLVASTLIAMAQGAVQTGAGGLAATIPRVG